METIVLTQAEFDAVPVFSGQMAVDGLVFKKKVGEEWWHYFYLSHDQGNYPIQVRLIDSTYYRQAIREKVGKELLTDIWKTLNNSALSEAVKASILSTISTTLIACLCGEVNVAKIIATATPTTADFNNGRKNILVGLIDQAIARL